jgi:hypothetical protein
MLDLALPLNVINSCLLRPHSPPEADFSEFESKLVMRLDKLSRNGFWGRPPGNRLLSELWALQEDLQWD